MNNPDTRENAKDIPILFITTFINPIEFTSKNG